MFYKPIFIASNTDLRNFSNKQSQTKTIYIIYSNSAENFQLHFHSTENFLG